MRCTSFTPGTGCRRGSTDFTEKGARPHPRSGWVVAVMRVHLRNVDMHAHQWACANFKLLHLPPTSAGVFNMKAERALRKLYSIGIDARVLTQNTPAPTSRASLWARLTSRVQTCTQPPSTYLKIATDRPAISLLVLLPPRQGRTLNRSPALPLPLRHGRACKSPLGRRSPPAEGDAVRGRAGREGN